MIPPKLLNLKTAQRAQDKKPEAKRPDIVRTSRVGGTQRWGLPVGLEFKVMSLADRVGVERY